MKKIFKNKNEQDGEGTYIVGDTEAHLNLYICQLNITSKFYSEEFLFVPLLPFLQNASSPQSFMSSKAVNIKYSYAV